MVVVVDTPIYHHVLSRNSLWMVGEVTAASMCCRWALPKGKMFTLILPILFFSYGRYTHGENAIRY